VVEGPKERAEGFYKQLLPSHPFLRDW
jgi:hypothetical protein